MNKPEKRKGKWRVRWYDHNGKRLSKTFETYRGAERALTKLQAEAQDIKVGVRPEPLPVKTFGDLCDYWMEHRASRKKSLKDDESILRRHLRPEFGNLLLKDLTLERVDAFRRRVCPDERDLPNPSRRRPSGGLVTVKTLHNILTLFISMLNLAVDLRWLAVRPTIKKPKLITPEFKYLRTKDEIRRFLHAAQDEDEGVYELYATAIYAGTRAGENLGLQWQDVDLRRRLITVQRSYNTTTKTDRIRYVPILDPLLPLLKEWRLRCPSKTWVFPSKVGTMQQPSARVLQETLHRVRIAACVDVRITFHDLRHTFASHWMMNGGDIYRLQRVLGHRSIVMTERYSHLSPTAFSADYAILGVDGLERPKRVGDVVKLSKR
ncbi:MAG: tyrosine-type recombinase/integrase [Pseudomonadota bacterium]